MSNEVGNGSAPLVSVIVPIYNAAAYLQECVDGIRNQTYRDLDIILVNDGSTDSSAQICFRASDDDSRVRVFDRENSGPSATRNFGLEKARGDFLLFVDADDVLLPAAIEECVRSVTTHDAEMVLFAFERIDNDGEVLDGGRTEETGRFPENQVVSAEQAVCWLLLGRFQNYVWRMFAMRSCWNGVVFPTDRNFLEDAQIYPFVILQAKGVEFLNKVLYQYRVTPGSLVSRQDALRMVLQKDEVSLRREAKLREIDSSFAPYCEAERYLMEYRCAFASLRYHRASEEERTRWNTSVRYLRAHGIPRQLFSVLRFKEYVKIVLAWLGMAFAIR